MDWSILEQLYLAISRILDGFIKFLMGKFDPPSSEEN